MSENEKTPVAPDVAAHEGGDRPAGDVDGGEDVGRVDDGLTSLEDIRTQVPPSRENLRLT